MLAFFCENVDDVEKSLAELFCAQVGFEKLESRSARIPACCSFEADCVLFSEFSCGWQTDSVDLQGFVLGEGRTLSQSHAAEKKRANYLIPADNPCAHAGFAYVGGY